MKKDIFAIVMLVLSLINIKLYSQYSEQWNTINTYNDIGVKIKFINPEVGYMAVNNNVEYKSKILKTTDKGQT